MLEIKRERAPTNYLESSHEWSREKRKKILHKMSPTHEKRKISKIKTSMKDLPSPGDSTQTENSQKD